MAEYTEIHLRRDSTLNWYASNPRLALGEPGIDMTLHRFKIGNGIDRWNELPYMNEDVYKSLDKTNQELADKVQDLLSKIDTNKLSADTQYTDLTIEVRNTSRELKSRMDAVEKEQKDYEDALTNEQADYETSINKRQDQHEQEVSEELASAKSEIKAGLDDFSETKEKLTIRMDAIVGQATNDTEILDARVDAKGIVHPNVGHNVREIHSQLIEAQETISVHKQELDTDIQALTSKHEADIQAINKQSAIENAERLTVNAKHDEAIGTLNDSAQKLNIHDEFLQEQIDTLADSDLQTNQNIWKMQQSFDTKIAELSEENTSNVQALTEAHEADIQQVNKNISALRQQNKADVQALTQKIDTDIDTLTERHEADSQTITNQNFSHGEHLQEQIDELATNDTNEALIRFRDKQRLELELAGTQLELEQSIRNEAQAREDKDTEISQGIETVSESLDSHDEFLQGQIDEVSQTLQANNISPWKAQRQQNAALNDEIQERKDSDEKLHEEFEQTAKGLVEDFNEGIKGTASNLNEHNEFLQEQIDTNAQILQQANIANWENNRELQYADKKLDEKIDDLSQLLNGEIEENTSGLGVNLADQDKHIQSQVDELSSAFITESVNRYLDNQKFTHKDLELSNAIEQTASDIRIDQKTADLILAQLRADITSGLQEQINQLAALKLKDLISNNRARENLYSHISIIEDVLISAGILDENDIPVSTEREFTQVIDDIFSGNSPDTPTPQTQDDEEFSEYLDEVFNP